MVPRRAGCEVGKMVGFRLEMTARQKQDGSQKVMATTQARDGGLRQWGPWCEQEWGTVDWIYAGEVESDVRELGGGHGAMVRVQTGSSRERKEFKITPMF